MVTREAAFRRRTPVTLHNGESTENAFNLRVLPRALRVFIGMVLVVALLMASAADALADSARVAGVEAENGVVALALRWFAEMRAGQIDRTQLTPEYSAQLTDEAVQGMSHYLKQHDYGVAPTRAEVVDTRSIGEQKFYVVKLVFPRGDAASLLLGLNAAGKITGLSLLSMAGD